MDTANQGTLRDGEGPSRQIKRKILIIEDEKDVRDLLIKRAESHLGFDCAWDDTGDNSLRLSREFRPNVILLDMNLPNTTGLTILREIKAIPDLADIPVIIFSAYGQPELVDEAMKLGASTYFTKGGSVSDLFDVVEAYI